MKLSHSIDYTGILNECYITSKDGEKSNAGSIIKLKYTGNINIINKKSDNIPKLYEELRVVPSLKESTDIQLDNYIKNSTTSSEKYLSDTFDTDIMIKFSILRMHVNLKSYAFQIHY
jgi:hypothetical protein